jgi:uroporphyrinogen decarboxylase
MPTVLTPRARIQQALAFQESEVVPYHLMIDEQVRPRLADYLGDPDFECQIDNHLPFYAVEPTIRWLGPDRYEDAFGSVWRRTSFPHLERWPLTEASLAGYAFPDLLDDECFRAAPEFLARHDRHFTFCSLLHGFFDRGWALRGMENFLADFIIAPAFVADLFERLTDIYERLIDRVAELGFDGIRFGDDWGYQRGVLIGAGRWRRQVKPGLKRIFERARRQGLTVMVHSDGDVTELIPDLIEMGVQILNPVQPEAMDQVVIKQRYGRHLCLNGGVSTQHTLPFGTPAEVRREVWACLRVLGQGGGYVLGPAKAILPDVPLENAAALIDAIVNQRGDLGPPASTGMGEAADVLSGVYARFHRTPPNMDCLRSR